MRAGTTALVLAGLWVFTVSTSAAARELDAEEAAAAAEPESVQRAVRAQRKRWTVRHNAISRLRRHERKRRLGVSPRKRGHEQGLEAFWPKRRKLPAAFDWRAAGKDNYVTPVRDQGACGSCWAFSTTGALESYVLRSRGLAGRDVDLAEQAIVSCSNGGSCQGGWPDRATEFLQETGLPQEKDFPYSGTDAPCVLTPAAKDSRRIGRWLHVDPSVDAIKQALVEHGPLPTTMAVYTDFFFYGGGVYSHSTGTLEGYHAILIVGYDDRARAFTVKNSWGTWWGEQGYFRIDYDDLKAPVGFGYDTLAYSTAAVSPVRVAVSGLSRREASRGAVELESKTGIASGDTVVTDVAYKVDDGEFQPGGSEAPWRLTLDTTKLADGGHVLIARAYDNAGNLGVQTLKFKVANHESSGRKNALAGFGGFRPFRDAGSADAVAER